MAKLLPTQIVISAFHEEGAADAVAAALKKAGIFYRNVAVIRKDKEGKVKVRETGEIKASHAAAVGAMVGGVALCLLGPTGVGIGAATGAAIGGAGAASIETFDKDRLKQIGNVLQPCNSAIIVVFEEVVIPKSVMSELAQPRDEIVYQLAKNIGETLRKGQDVGYMYAVTEEGVVASRMAAGADAANIQGLLIGADGAMAGKAAISEEEISYEVIAAAVSGGEDTVIEEGATKS